MGSQVGLVTWEGGGGGGQEGRGGGLLVGRSWKAWGGGWGRAEDGAIGGGGGEGAGEGGGCLLVGEGEGGAEDVVASGRWTEPRSSTVP